MARTLENVTIHTTNIADYVVKLAVTADGHFAARAGINPTDAHDAIFAWLQTLPELPAVDHVAVAGQPVEPVVMITPEPIAVLVPTVEPDAS